MKTAARNQIRITPEFVTKIVDTLVVLNDVRNRAGLSKSALISWRKKAEEGKSFSATLTVVAKVIQSGVFKNQCTPEFTGLDQETCDQINRYLGNTVAAQTRVAEVQQSYETSVTFNAILAEVEIYRSAIGAIRYWIDQEVKGNGHVGGIDYSLRHSDRVLRHLETLIRPFVAKGDFDANDAFLLVLTALLHDFGYFYPDLPRNPDEANAATEEHSHRIAEVISDFVHVFPPRLEHCISEVTGNDKDRARQVKDMLRGISPHLALFVRLHNTDQVFLAEHMLKDIESSAWQGETAKALAFLAIFQLADSLDFNYQRVDLQLRTRLAMKKFDDLKPAEQQTLARQSMLTAFAPAEIECDQREILVVVHPRVGGAKTIGNEFIARCNKYLEDKVFKDRNPLLPMLEKFTGYDLYSSSVAQEEGGFEIRETDAIAYARVLTTRESDGTISIDDVLSDILRVCGGHLTWVKLFHPRGFLYGGKSSAHADLRAATSFVDRISFDPGKWGTKEMQPVTAIESAYEFFKNSGMPMNLYRYYIIATTGVESEMYVVLFGEDEYENIPVLCINVHFLTTLSESELVERGQTLLRKLSTHAKTILTTRVDQVAKAMSVIQSSEHFDSHTKAMVCQLLDDFGNWIPNGEFFDFANLESLCNGRFVRLDDGSAHKRIKNRGVEAFVADKHWLTGWVERLVKVTNRHGFFNFSYGVTKGMPSVHLTVRIPQRRKLQRPWIGGVTTYTEMFQQLESVLVRQDFASNPLHCCLDESYGAWKELLLVAYEGRLLVEASGGSITLVGKYTLYDEDLGFRLEFPCKESFAA